MPRPVMTSPHKNSLTDRCDKVSVVCAATLMSKSAWPKTVQRLWRGGLGVLKFPGGQTRCKGGEHHTSGFFYIDAGVAMDAIMNTLKKGASTLGCQVSAWMPSFIIEPAQQWWQLRSDVYCLISRKAVAQRMQGCQQNQIDPARGHASRRRRMTSSTQASVSDTATRRSCRAGMTISLII